MGARRTSYPGRSGLRKQVTVLNSWNDEVEETFVSYQALSSSVTGYFLHLSCFVPRLN